jgi:Tol biopolymer transport system component
MHKSLLLALACAAPLAAQTPATLQARYDSAYYAWDAGDYPDALARFERLLSVPSGARFVEQIALLTGELYRSTRIAPDGAAPRWSMDGRRVSFTTMGGRVGYVVGMEGDSAHTLARVNGVGLTLSPDGAHAAYYEIPETPELRVARALGDSLQRAGEFQRMVRQRQEVQRLERELAKIMLRDLATGTERELKVPDLQKAFLVFSPDGRTLYFTGSTRADSTRADIYVIEDVTGAAAVRALVEGPGLKFNPLPARRGDFLVYQVGPTVAVRNLSSGDTRSFDGIAPSLSSDGTLLTWLTRTTSESTISTLSLAASAEPVVVKRSARPLNSPAASPDGQRVAYTMQLRDDWEVYVVGANGQGDTRLSREIQHDRFPRWLNATQLLAMKGEPRHTRAYIYDVSSGDSRRLHHNNTVRTVAPEYDWAPSPDGTKVLVVADRDGDTISPERALYLVDLSKPVTQGDVLRRVRASAAAERDLRDRGRRMFAATDAAIRAALRDVSVARIYGYERALYEVDSKFITQPGNQKAIEFISSTLRSWGYTPEVQWFEPRPGVRTANIIATLRGAANPRLIYVVSSHFDSVEPGPGADDNTSGTSALLEAARVLARRPQAATIKFAWFTGEEGGLLGSREFVRRAVATGDSIVGALNNDMIGWANDHRLDNTIRYSNDGIRDLQHAAAFLFTNLITYDARYYQGTDAHAYYEAYGDIVGGIGSYPILGNPHYHQPHDILETINHQLVAEVSKTTVATLIQLASSPSRIRNLNVTEAAGGAEARWTRAPERGTMRYIVTYGPPSNPTARTATVTSARAMLPGAQLGWVVAVKAVNARGLEAWDWARAPVKARATAQGAFWNSLHDLCGKSFIGTITESVPADTLFGDATLQMHVRTCSPNEIRIPFHVGDDRSRTWVMSRTPNGLRLKHDHRHRDGTPDRVTQYGGDTREPGTAIFQDFFADAHTASLIPAASSNVWTIELVSSERFVYALRREGTERRFRVTFNLRQPVAPPPPPWGSR